MISEPLAAPAVNVIKLSLILNQTVVESSSRCIVSRCLLIKSTVLCLCLSAIYYSTERRTSQWHTIVLSSSPSSVPLFQGTWTPSMKRGPYHKISIELKKVIVCPVADTSKKRTFLLTFLHKALFWAMVGSLVEWKPNWIVHCGWLENRLLHEQKMFVKRSQRKLHPFYPASSLTPFELKGWRQWHISFSRSHQYIYSNLDVGCTLRRWDQ